MVRRADPVINAGILAAGSGYNRDNQTFQNSYQMTDHNSAFGTFNTLLKRPVVRNTLFAVVALSLFQLASDGRVTWPATAVEKIGDSLSEYAGRPTAAWRRAADKIEELGAAREGQPTPEFGLVGRVVRVADGDTLSILGEGNVQYKIRLHGIDAPERDQAHGRAAWNTLSRLVAGQTVGVVVLGEDSYGRTDGTVYLGDKDINLAMIESGYAWWYRHYARNDRLLEATEQRAREAGRGLWADPEPIPPWDWRRQQRYSR